MMVFYETTFTGNGRWGKNLACTKCGRKFKIGEKVFIKRQGKSPYNTRTVGRLCKKCYDFYFIDVDNGQYPKTNGKKNKPKNITPRRKRGRPPLERHRNVNIISPPDKDVEIKTF
jgi:hypothetical protein